MNTVHQQNVVVRSPYFPAINWGAIFAGIIVGLATQLVLALLGFAAGLSAVDMTEGGAALSGNAPLYAGAWQGISMLIAAFVGGYVAARMSGLHRKTDGMLHGFVTWSATTLLFALLTTSALGVLFGGVFDATTRAPDAQTVEGASIATWTVFGALALSLVLGVVGGLAGAKGSRRAPRPIAD